MNGPVNRKRRRLLCGIVALPVTGLAAIDSTPSAAEGPFYPLAGMRFDDIDSDLVKVAGKVALAGGEIVTLAGRVLEASGTPVAGARIEIWQCDVNGRYLHRGDRGATCIVATGVERRVMTASRDSVTISAKRTGLTHFAP